jgi:pyruvate dehydrogenase complex dehydrogenase (E1) component
LEQAIRHVRAGEEYPLHENRSEVNAKVQLLASETVGEKYAEAVHLLERWSELHVLASPRKMKAGETSYELIQAPDPTAKYKQPAAEAHDGLQKCIGSLVQAMRAELRGAV